MSGFVLHDRNPHYYTKKEGKKYVIESNLSLDDMLLQTSSETTALRYKLMQDNTESQKACILE